MKLLIDVPEVPAGRWVCGKCRGLEHGSKPWCRIHRKLLETRQDGQCDRCRACWLGEQMAEQVAEAAEAAEATRKESPE